MSTIRLVRAPAPGTRSSQLAGAVLGVLVLVALPLSLAAPASAHDELVSTLPANGEVLAEPPTEVSLTFGEEVGTLGTAVVVTDGAGAKLADGKVVVQGPLVTQAIIPPTVGGSVRVSYRVVSADGHTVTGTFSFTVPAPASPSQSVSPTDSASPSPTAPSPTAPTAVESSSPPAEALPSTTPASSDGDGSPLPWLLGGATVLALAGAAVAARRTGKAGSPS
jgi:methionine-rich copper-binding protein CopC